MKAIHNAGSEGIFYEVVVNDPQRFEFESNSQPTHYDGASGDRCQ
ncbi:MAG: hypothetical protein WBA16_08580 [Nonlabens sp.]